MSVLFALFGAIGGLALILAVFSEETRREQALMTLIGWLIAPAILLLVSHHYINPTWLSSPSSWVLPILFVGVVFGIASVAFEAFIGPHTKMIKEREWWFHRKHPMNWVLHTLFLLSIWFCITLFGLSVFEMAPTPAFAIGGLLVGTYIVAKRHDLLVDAIASAILLSLLIFVTEQILFAYFLPASSSEIWRTEALTGVFLGHVPLEELVWATVVGFTVAPLYQYVRLLGRPA